MLKTAKRQHSISVSRLERIEAKLKQDRQVCNLKEGRGDGSDGS